MKIIPDRDKWRNWYVDADITFDLLNEDVIVIKKGYRFDGHTVPLFMRWIFPTYNENDIYAALIHDYLLDTQPWHRYSRKFIDEQYAFFMKLLSTGKRKKYMPLAVTVWGFLTKTMWGDNRGKIKPNTHVTVVVK